MAQAPVGPPPARSNPTGIRFGSATPLACCPDSKVLDAPPTKFPSIRPSPWRPISNCWCSSPPPPAFNVDVKIAEMMKDNNPKLKVAFVGPPVTTEPEKISARHVGHRFRGEARIRLRHPRLRHGQAAGRNSQRRVPERRRHSKQPRSAGDRKSRRTAVGDESLQARPGFHALQRSVPAQPIHLVLHQPRLSGAMHLLPVAANAFGASLASALVRRHRERMPLCVRELPGLAGNLLRRRYLQLSEGAHH